ncbi:MAG: hypothetical protein LAN37_13000 [Acidobacteriia bacterium]|nr:hypothetical protein [Terriglobia bacterium]
MAQHLVTIATYRELSDALLAKGKLDAAGIHCVLSTPAQGEGARPPAVLNGSPGLDSLRAKAFDDVHLQVSEDDAETATEILTGAAEDEDLDDLLDQPLCPTCGSMDLHYHDGKHWRPWVGVFVAGEATVASHKREWRCDECGATWVEEQPGAETVN